MDVQQQLEDKGIPERPGSGENVKNDFGRFSDFLNFYYCLLYAVLTNAELA